MRLSKGKSASREMTLQHPRAMTSSISLSKLFRFQATTAGTYDINTNDVADLLCVATSSTAAYRLVNNFRIIAVELWGPATTGTIAQSTVQIDWDGSLPGGNKRQTDTVLGSSQVAHLRSRPAPGSYAGLWQSGGNNSLFRLVVPQYTIIDLTLEITLRDSGDVSAVGAAVSGATTGATYVRALNSNVSTTALAPVGWATI